MKNKKIALNETEISLAQQIAKARYDQNRANGVVDKKIGPQSAEETDLNGIGSEIAVAKYMNLYPDLNISPRSGGWDLITSSGSKIDVKNTVYQNGRLLATLKKKEEDIDAYVLTIGEFPNYDIIGWALKHELIQDDNIMDLGHGKGYVLSQNKLHKF